VVYYVLLPEYTAYLDIQQIINLEIYQRFNKEGIEFAYPTQTVIMSQEE
ncbi:MAG: mechanosensitive ion channel family protein, partial [Chloroflexi bacterium]|nr:mechanosensitive ion channel family protein [Chloroflexota bacterium]